MHIVDPDDLFPIDLTDAPPGAPEDPDAAAAELEQVGLNHQALAAVLAADPDRWRVTDDDSAEWVAGKLAAERTTIVNDQARLDEYRARLDRWFEGRVAAARRRAAFFEAHLALYALAERERGRKSIKLPSATLTTRGPDARKPLVERLVVSIGDRDAVLAWAAEHRPDLVKSDPTVQVSTLRSAVTVEWCPDCDGAGEVAEMGSDPNLTETIVACSCVGGVRVWATTADGERVEVRGVTVEEPAPTATVTT